MTRVAIVHPGQMGAAFGAVLVAAGHDVGWLPAGRSAATRARADAAGLRPLADVADRDVVLSICPPDRARSTARSLAAFDGVYVDANAISPASAAAVADTVAGRYVDAGIIGGPPAPGAPTDLYLSGDGLDPLIDLFAGTPVRVRVVDGAGPYAASAVKQTFAAWTKISRALLLAAEATADGLGVGDALRAQWTESAPDAMRLLAAGHRDAGTKGWRWVGEMREIAATFAGTGQPEGFGLAAAEVYSAYP